MRKPYRDTVSEEAIRRVSECLSKPETIRVFVRIGESGERTSIQTRRGEFPICCQCSNEQLCRAMIGAACRDFNRKREDEIRKHAERCRHTG